MNFSDSWQLIHNWLKNIRNGKKSDPKSFDLINVLFDLKFLLTLLISGIFNFHTIFYLPIALKAREVPHMPRPPLRLCAFVGKYNLVTSTASRLQRFRMMPATVQLAILPEVYQVDEQLPAYATDEAGRMPEGGWTGAARSHCHLAGRNRPATFAASGAVGPVQLARVSSPKRFAFPLRGEHPKLPLLLLGQPAAVPCLVVVRWELLQQLLHPFPLAGAARVRDLVFR